MKHILRLVMKFSILLILFVRSGLMSSCPYYCTCYRNSNYNYVVCVNKGLNTLDLNLPSSVQWLRLTNNSIHSLESYVFWRLKLIEIENLELDRNTITNIDYQAFTRMDDLKRVNLSNNHLYKIDARTFINNLKLISLDLSYNTFQNIPGSFLISSSLQALSMESCHLSYLSMDALTKVPLLKTLNIMNNRLIDISPYFFIKASSLTQVYITGNLLGCGRPSYNELLDNLESTGIHLIDENCLGQSRKTFTKQNSQINTNALEKNIKKIQVETNVKPFSRLDSNQTNASLSKTTQSAQEEITTGKSFTIWIVWIVLLSGLFLGVIIAFIVCFINKLYKRCKWWVTRSNRRSPNRNLNPTAPPEPNNPLPPQLPLIYTPNTPHFIHPYMDNPKAYLQLYRR